MSDPSTISETKSVRTVCPYCGVGCGMILKVKDGKIVRVQGDKDHASNHGRLCTKGLTSSVPVDHTDRLKYFQSREKLSDSFDFCLPEDALDAVAKKFGKILEESGPDALAFYVSGQMSTEAQYVSNKLCKGFWGTNNIDSNSRLCMASAASGYKQSFGADSPEASYEDIDYADAFFAIGSNMADCHPILFQQVMRRVKEHGAKLIVVDPRRTATAEAADLYLQIEPGTDLALLNGLLNGLIQRGCVDQRFIAEKTEGFEKVLSIVSKFPIEITSELTGLSNDSINEVLDVLSSSKNWMSFWTMGLNQSLRGTAHTSAICNLHLLTGQIGKRGSGPFSLTGQPNAMGGREVGYLAAGLPGQRAVINPKHRSHVERLWGVPEGTIQAKPGAVAQHMFAKVRSGEIRGIWVIGTNPVASMPKNGGVADALKFADCVVVQDVFEGNETSKFAHYLFPGSLWAEAEGTMVNSERRITLMQKAVDAPGHALPDWKIICEVAKRMGYSGFDYAGPEEIFDEVKSFRNEMTNYVLDGVSYERLRSGPLQWPCHSAESPGESKRYGWHYSELPQGKENARIKFATASGRAQFVETPYTPDEEPGILGSLILNTGRYPHQWHTLTKTGRVKKLNDLNKGPELEIHPIDAERLGIEENHWVTVESSNGKFRIPAKITDVVLPGNCFAPIHWNQAFQDDGSVNAATLEDADPVSLQPALKSASVLMQAGPPVGETNKSQKQVEADAFEEGFRMAQQSIQFFRRSGRINAVIEQSFKNDS
ncbi:MAG: nitrate reductase [Verrucomicrobiota bacterium]